MRNNTELRLFCIFKQIKSHIKMRLAKLMLSEKEKKYMSSELKSRYNVQVLLQHNGHEIKIFFSEK